MKKQTAKVKNALIFDFLNVEKYINHFNHDIRTTN